MARVDVPVTRTKPTGVNPAAVSGDSTNGHEFTNDGLTLLEVTGTGAGATVTIVSAAQLAGLDVDDIEEAIAAGEVWHFGPLESGVFNAAGGKVHVDLSADDVELRAFSVH